MNQKNPPQVLRNEMRADSVPVDEHYSTEGYFYDNPILTRTGIFKYKLEDGSERRELRRPEDVFDPASLASYEGKPIIITHDAQAIDKNNARRERVGTILTPGQQDGETVRAKIVIDDPDAVKASGLRELSVGYYQDLIMEPGEWEGEPYDAIQTHIRVNHLALVAVARAGDDARLNMDGQDNGGTDPMDDENKKTCTTMDDDATVEPDKQTADDGEGASPAASPLNPAGIEAAIKAYACEMDIRHFYPSVPIRRLIRALGRKIKDKRFLRLIWAILKSCGQGLAIGYYICQWLANFYLEKLDWMLARMPGVKYYTRYMDNITMLGPNKRMLHRARVAAEKFLRDELGLAVKENWQVYRTAVARKAKGRPRAVSAVGFRFWHGFTTLRRRNFLRMLRQARRIQKKQKMGIPVSVQQAAGFLSRAGQLNHCNSFRVKEKYIRSIKIKRLKEVIRNESKRQCKAGWALYGRTPPATA